VVGHFPLRFMNIFNEPEAAFFTIQTMLPEELPFSQIIFNVEQVYLCILSRLVRARRPASFPKPGTFQTSAGDPCTRTELLSSSFRMDCSNSRKCLTRLHLPLESAVNR